MSTWPGRRSGPVALVTSMEERSLRVQRVRRRVNVVMVGSTVEGVRVGGVVGALKLDFSYISLLQVGFFIISLRQTDFFTMMYLLFLYCRPISLW